MKRIKFIILLNVLVSLSSSANSISKQPNILLLVSEDLSSRIGAFGDKVAQTPNLDKLAKLGVRYPNTFTTAGVCAPSRAALISGVHQIDWGGQHMRSTSFADASYRSVPHPYIKGFPELLRQYGYFTYVQRKLDYQFSGKSAKSGPFTIWDYTGKDTGWHHRAEGQPFFGMYHVNTSHESNLFPKKMAINKKNGRVKNWIKPADVVVPPYYPDIPEVRAGIASHHNNIRAVDNTVGEILANLKVDGLREDTIVIWTTDHGDGLPRGKREIYDSGIKVPMIIYWPEQYRPSHVIEGSVDEQLISFVDLPSTILTMANIETPKYIHGKDRIINKNTAKRNFIYASKDRLDGFEFRERAVRNKQFKYIKNYMPNRPGATHIKYRDQMPLMQQLWKEFNGGRLNAQQSFWFNKRPAEELYDIINDPHEVNNLAATPTHSKQLIIMRNALVEWQRKVNDMSIIPEIEMANDFWPNGKQPITPRPSLFVDESRLVTIKSTELGASIGYQINKGPWKLYTQPLKIKIGEKLTAKSVRYGWEESKTTSRMF